MSERCPRCGCDKQLDVSEFLDGRDWGVLYYCGTIYWPSRDEVTTEGVACRQLTQAQEQLQQALAREAELRRVVEAAIAARDAFRLYDNPEKWHKAIAKLARVVEDLDPKLVIALDREEGRTSSNGRGLSPTIG